MPYFSRFFRMGIAALLLCLPACSQVRPRSDYDKAAALVAEATGESSVYHPDDDQRVQALVEEMLAEGLSADEAVRIALLNSPTLQAAFYRIGMARAELVQSGLFSNPSLTFSLQFPQGGGRSNLQASLAQNIVDLWQIPVRKRVAEAALTETVLTIAREGSQLAADAKAAYFAAVAADRSHSIVKENLEVAQGLLKATLARQKAGTVGELDVNLARSPALSAELDVQTARLDAATARRRLATLLGLTTNAEELRLTDPLPRPPEANLSPDPVVAVALAARLDLKAARQATAAAEQRVREEYLQVFPNIAIGPFLQRNEQRALPGRNILADTARASAAAGALTAPDIQSRGQRNQERRQRIDSMFGPALTMTLPIFDQNQAQIAKAEYAYQQTLKQLDAMERTIVQETRQAVDRAMTAWAVARFYETQIVPQAQKSLDLSDASYRAGKTSIITVLEAQRTLLATRRMGIDAMRAAAVAIADLERITGRPATVLLSQVTATSQPSAEQEPKPMPNRTPAQPGVEVPP